MSGIFSMVVLIRWPMQDSEDLRGPHQLIFGADSQTEKAAAD
jgi:hypothetical protein